MFSVDFNLFSVDSYLHCSLDVITTLHTQLKKSQSKVSTLLKFTREVKEVFEVFMLKS